NCTSSGFQRGMNLRENLGVFFDVLNHVKGPDHIELLNCRNRSRVHLHEQDVCAKTLARERKALKQKLTADKRQMRECHSQCEQDGASSTTYFQQSACARKIFADQAHDKPGAIHEPKVRLLEFYQGIKKVCIKALSVIA